MNIYLLWIDNPRSIEANEWPSRQSVNGGWTIPNTNTIYIYRQEEWDRVFLHEMIHALNWDWKMPTEPLQCWKFTENDTIYPHLFEAWTELYAEWLWCGWHNQSWEKQREWQNKQALQILSRRNIDTTWKENTSVFAYYILKAILAPHIEFLWAFGNGQTADERLKILCSLVTPTLEQLRIEAKEIQPTKLSMRMTWNSLKN
jgi:hypothetical protein